MGEFEMMELLKKIIEEHTDYSMLMKVMIETCYEMKDEGYEMPDELLDDLKMIYLMMVQSQLDTGDMRMN